VTNVELLTTAQVARRLHQSEEVLRRKAREGILPAVRLGHGPRAPLRFPADELERWLYRSSPAPGNDLAEGSAPDSRHVEPPTHGGEAAYEGKQPGGSA
jgi:excisionase family DNA binding protein